MKTQNVLPLRSLLLFVPLAVVGVSSAAAQDTRVSTDTVEVTAYRVPTLLNETTQGVSVLNSEEIVVRHPESTIELLSQIPGLQVDQSGSPGGISNIYIRGSDPNHTLVIVDGIRMNDPSTNRGGGYDLTTIDPAHIERIEIIRGGGSAIYGADAMGGVINIVTKRGKADGVHESVSASVGNHDYRAASASLSGGSEQVQAAFSASNRKDGRPEDGGTIDLAVFSGALDVQLSDSARFSMTTFNTNRGSTSFTDDSGGIKFAVNRVLEHKRSEERAVGAGLRWKVRENVDVNFSLSAYDRAEDVNSPRVPPGVRSAFGLPANSSHTDFSRTTGLASATLALPLDSGLTAGYEHVREDGSNTTRVPAFFTTSVFGLVRDTDSLFVEAESKPVSGLIVHAGLRHDEITAYGSRNSPSAGLRYQFHATGTVLKANYAKGFRPPSFFALGLLPALGGNPKLVSETNTNKEIGAEQPFLGDHGWLSLTWFRNAYNNLVDFDTSINKLVNRPQITAEGVESAVRYRLSDSLRVGAQVTYAHTRRDDTGSMMRNRPDWRGGFDLSYEINEAMSFNGQTTYVGSVLDSSIPTGDTTLHPYWRTDLAGRYKINTWLAATAAIDNVFDKKYDQFVGFENPGVRVRVGVSAQF